MIERSIIKSLFCQFGNDALSLFSECPVKFYEPLPQRFRDRKQDFRDMFGLPNHFGIHDKYKNIYDGKQVVALQLRRGDFGNGKYYIPPNEWYLEWLSGVWPTMDSPALYISSDEPEKVVDDFSEYSPLTCVNVFGLDNKLNRVKAYADTYMLSVADYVAISNSTFGFVGCMMNPEGRFWRPGFDKKLEEFDPWTSSPVLLFRKYMRERICDGNLDNGK